MFAGAAAGGNQRRQRLAQDFLVWMDQTGDLLSLAERQEVDPIKQERMEVRGYFDVVCTKITLFFTIFIVHDDTLVAQIRPQASADLCFFKMRYDEDDH